MFIACSNDYQEEQRETKSVQNTKYSRRIRRNSLFRHFFFVFVERTTKKIKFPFKVGSFVLCLVPNDAWHVNFSLVYDENVFDGSYFIHAIAFRSPNTESKRKKWKKESKHQVKRRETKRQNSCAFKWQFGVFYYKWF